MNPDEPERAGEVAAELEEWSALVETLEKHGTARALLLPFKVTALRASMTHASDWLDEWQQGFYGTLNVLNLDTYQKPRTKRADWAREKS